MKLVFLTLCLVIDLSFIQCAISYYALRNVELEQEVPESSVLTNSAISCVQQCSTGDCYVASYNETNQQCALKGKVKGHTEVVNMKQTWYVGISSVKEINVIKPNMHGISKDNFQAHPVEHAFDDNVNTLFASRESLNPWFAIDLLKDFEITKIRLTVRSDYPDRHHPLKIFVSSKWVPSEIKPDSLLPLFAFQDTAPAVPNPLFELDSGSMMGRYVYFVLDKFEVIEALNVEVYALVHENNEEPKHIVMPSMPTDSSSALFPTSNAIDEEETTSFISNNENNPWFSIDLLRNRLVTKIRVTLKDETSWALNFSPVKVKMSNEISDNIIYLTQSPALPSEFDSLPLFASLWELPVSIYTEFSNEIYSGIPGRYLYISMEKTEQLRMDELEVFALDY